LHLLDQSDAPSAETLQRAGALKERAGDVAAVCGATDTATHERSE
jgi:hypothetical protein